MPPSVGRINSLVTLWDFGEAQEREEAIRILQRLVETARMKYISPSALTIAAIGCGDVEQTYEWLNKGVDEHDPLIITVSGNAPFPGHEQDPRYRALRRRMNLDLVQIPRQN